MKVYLFGLCAALTAVTAIPSPASALGGTVPGGCRLIHTATDLTNSKNGKTTTSADAVFMWCPDPGSDGFRGARWAPPSTGPENGSVCPTPDQYTIKHLPRNVGEPIVKMMNTPSQVSLNLNNPSDPTQGGTATWSTPSGSYSDDVKYTAGGSQIVIAGVGANGRTVLAADTALWAIHPVTAQVYLDQPGTWDSASGQCAGAQYSTSDPWVSDKFLTPPVTSTDIPPTPGSVGGSITDNYENTFYWGTLNTYPQGTSYVNIPTCLYISGYTLPRSTQYFHSIASNTLPTGSRGVDNVYFEFILKVAPGPITWDFGDGHTGTGLPATSKPPTPHYVSDPGGGGHWDGSSCNGVSHTYGKVSPGAGWHIRGTQDFDITMSVVVHDGAKQITFPNLTPPKAKVTAHWPSDGSTFPISVYQIQGIPFVPKKP